MSDQFSIEQLQQLITQAVGERMTDSLAQLHNVVAERHTTLESQLGALQRDLQDARSVWQTQQAVLGNPSTGIHTVGPGPVPPEHMAIPELAALLQSSTNSFKVPPPAKITGNDKHVNLRYWFTDAETFFVFCKLPVTAWPMAVPLFVTGPARVSWQTWYENPENPKDWESFKTYFLKRFLPEGQETVLRNRLYNLKQVKDGKVRAYTDEFITIAEQIPDLGEGEKLFNYMKGLKLNIRVHVANSNPRRFSEAVSAAISVGDVNNSYSSAGADMAVRHAPHGPSPMVLGAIGADMNRNGSRGKRNFGLSPEEFQRRRSQNLCFKCGQSGHAARQCPARPNAQA